jgi:anti-anti-sigma regulatory factor
LAVKVVDGVKMDVSVFGGEDDVTGIVEVRKRGKEGVLVELRGEFDRYNLEDLQETLNGVVALKRPTLVDLSGVTFLDVRTSRELAIRSLPDAHHLTLRNPSWQVRASMVACGLGAWVAFHSDRTTKLSAPPERGAVWGHSPTAPKTRSGRGRCGI